MSTVTKLEDYRKAKTRAVKLAPPERLRFFCANCDTDLFKFYTDGEVRCQRCNTVISNLEVRQK